MIEHQNIPLSPAVRVPFCCSWSEDDRISVITSKGIHIFEIIPNPNSPKLCFNTNRTWISLPDIKPTSETGIEPNNLIWRLPAKEVYELILNAWLAPNLLSTKPVPSLVTQLSWSPAGLVPPHRCLMACVLNSGAVYIYCSHSCNWIIVGNISKLWLEYQKTIWPNEFISNPRLGFAALKERVLAIKMTAITWGPFCPSTKPFAPLVVGHSNGQVSLWRINQVEIVDWDQADISLELVLDTGLNQITSVQWQTIDNIGFVFVGDICGHAKFIKLSHVDGKFQKISITDLWTDSDRLQVTKILILPQSQQAEHFSVIVAKQTFLMVFLLNIDGKIVKECSHFVGSLNISSMVSLSNSSLLVVTHTGYTSLFTIKKDSENKLIVEREEVTCSLNSKDHAVYGVATSRKHAVWAVVRSLCKAYDHLIQRKPSQVVFYSLENDVDPYTILKDNEVKVLTKCGSLLELLRINYIRNKTVPDLDDKCSSYEMYQKSYYALKLELWIAKLKYTLVSGCNDDKKTQVQEYCASLEKILQLKHAVDTVMKQAATLEEDLGMTSLFFLWLQIATPIPLKSYIEESINYKAPNKIEENEICAICGNSVTMTSDYKTAECLLGHRLPRCCLTLKQCIMPPYLICSTCGIVAHISAGESETPLCLYCDSHLIPDSRIKAHQTEEPVKYRLKSNISCGKPESKSEKSFSKAKDKNIGANSIEQHTIVLEAKENKKRNK